VKLQIKQKDRRALIILALALVIYEVGTAVVLPAYDKLVAARDLVSDKESELRRYRRAQLRKGQYADLLKVTADRVAKSESAVIVAANAPLASSQLQSMIEEAATKTGLMLGQRTIGSVKRLNDFYAELPVTLSFDSTPGQLVAFLSELRREPRFLTVRSLQVSPVETILEAPKGMAVSKTVRVLMTVVSLTTTNIVKTDGVSK
jgi:Tfp pilus assembly protein PilO